MIRFFPESALSQLEFDKIKQILQDHCQSAYAKEKASQLRVHTRKEFIDRELRQSHEFTLLLSTGQYFPNDTVFNITSELKLLSIPGAVLTAQQFQLIRKLAETAGNIFRWFSPENRSGFPGLALVIDGLSYEKEG
jgi:DNA mismatch repair protein MutS2